MGILVNTGFDVGSSSPIDSRTVKNTTDERDALVTDGLVYENLKVYCKDTQTEYRWTGTEWEEVGTGGSGSGTDISMTDYYTKTEVNNDFLKKTDAASTYATKTDIETISSIILDSEVRLDKTYSSSKIYSSIQDAIDTSKAYTLSELGKMSGASYKVVTATNEMTDEKIIYLLDNGTTFDMYIVDNGTPTKIGDTDVDLSDYYTKTEMDNDFLKKVDADSKYATITTVSGKIDKDKIVTALDGTVTDDEVPSARLVYDTTSKFLKTYTSLSQLGLDSTATLKDITKAMANNSIIAIKVDAMTDQSEYNNITQGTVTIYKLEDARIQAIMTDKTSGGTWIGILGDENTIIGWKRVVTEAEITNVLANTSTINQIPNANLVAGEIHGKFINLEDYSDALRMPSGKWRVDSDYKASLMQNLPVPEAGILEVKYLHGNDGANPFTATFKYSMLTYTTINGGIYKRSFNSNITAGKIVNDTGWEKIAVNETRVTTLETQVSELFQSVSNGKTAVANAITGKGVTTSTTATFATMAANIGKIGGYKEETKSYTTTSTGITPITLTFSANVLGIKQVITPTYSSRINAQTSADMFTINGKELTFYVTGAGTWLVTALIKA